MTVRHRPLWTLLAAALILMPVLYVASFGPWFWLYAGPLRDRPEHPIHSLRSFYSPLIWGAKRGPEPARQALRWYVMLTLP